GTSWHAAGAVASGLSLDLGDWAHLLRTAAPRPKNRKSGTEEAEHRENPAEILGLSEIEFGEDSLDLGLHGRGVRIELLADRLVRVAFRDQSNDFALSLGQLVERLLPSRSVHEPGD